MRRSWGTLYAPRLLANGATVDAAFCAAFGAPALDEPDRLSPDIHTFINTFINTFISTFISTKQPWLQLMQGLPAVPAYCERADHGPAASLARRAALL